ncbi:hypothetical protein CDIK_4304, partial [Cucumispora dikerogammari]
NCYRKALDNALNIGDAQATDGDNTVDNDTVFCYATENEIPENDAELIEYLVNTECIEGTSSEKTDICIKKITSLDAMVMLEELETWFCDNKSEGLIPLLKLKQLILEEINSRRSKILDFLRLKRI